MRSVAEFLRFLNIAAFVLLALVTFVQWRRARHTGALWVFLTFLDLAFVAAIALVFPDDPETALLMFLEASLIGVLVLFPYFLYRVSAAFIPTSRTFDVVAAGMTMLVVGWALGLPSIPGEGEPQPASFRVFILAFLLQWTFLSVVVAVRFWRAGRRQRAVAAIRMKILSGASIALSLVLIITGATSGAEDVPALDLFTRSVTTLSVLAFFLAFAPPKWLRTIWIRPIADSLRQRTVDLMAATQESEVTDILLPAALEIVGGEAIAIVDPRGKILGSRGFEEASLEEARLLLAAATAEEKEALAPDLVSLKFPFGWLLLRTGRYTTFFGTEEIQLLGALGALANLAIERVHAEELKVELAQANVRRQQALEINDNIVQGLAVAKYAFELNQNERAKNAVDATLEAARKIISDLVGELGENELLHAGSLTRDEAASGYSEGQAAS